MIALVPILCIAALGVVSDLLMPGHKPVRHELVLLDDSGAARRYVAGPWPGLAGITPIEVGMPFTFSSKYGTKIYALPPGVALPERFDPEFFARYPVSNLMPNEVRSVSVTSPLARVRTTLRVVDLREGRLYLEIVSEVRRDAGGRILSLDSLLPLVLSIAVVGLAGLLIIARGRRRARAKA